MSPIRRRLDEEAPDHQAGTPRDPVGTGRPAKGPIPEPPATARHLATTPRPVLSARPGSGSGPTSASGLGGPRGPGGRAIERTAPPTQLFSAAPDVATERTAEIPVVDGPGNRSRHPVELADGTVWYPGVSRRLPAPFLVRLGVWLLFFVLLLGLGGLAVERYHPDWLSFLRRTAPSGPQQSAIGASGTSGGGTTGTRAAGRTSGTGALSLVSSSTTTTTYAVPTSSYRLVVTFPHAAWIEIASPAGSTHYLVAQTYQPSASPVRVRVSGTADVDLGAATTSIAVVSNGRTLGAVDSPSVGHTYRFAPSPGSG